MKLTAVFLLLNTLQFSTATNKYCHTSDSVILRKLYKFAELEDFTCPEIADSRSAGDRFVAIQTAPTKDVNVHSTLVVFKESENEHLQLISVHEKRYIYEDLYKPLKKRSREQFGIKENIPPSMTPQKHKTNVRWSDQVTERNTKKLDWKMIHVHDMKAIVEMVNKALREKNQIYYQAESPNNQVKDLQYPTKKKTFHKSMKKGLLKMMRNNLLID